MYSNILKGGKAMEKKLSTQTSKNPGNGTDLYYHKKLVMEKIYKSDIYKEFISQWQNTDVRTLVMDGIDIQKKG